MPALRRTPCDLVYLRMRAALLLLFSVHCFGLCAQQETHGEISGYVIDAASHDSVYGALVYVSNTTLGAQTDMSGHYQLTKIPAGIYDIIAQSTGYKRDTLRGVVVSSGKITQLNIELSWPSCCEDSWPTLPAFSKKKALAVGVVQGALITSSLTGLHQLWYKQYPRESFHTFNDNAEWLQMDKVGHGLSAYAIGYVSSEMWKWTGMRPRRSVLIGGITGFSYLTAIEIMDGYSSGWGFSTGDMIANAAGTSLLIGQEFLWNQQRITPKFGFRQSGFAHYRPELLGENYVEQIIKDYNGQTYWLSCNLASFMSRNTTFPRWINVAIGYGAAGMTGGHQNPSMTNAQGNEITFSRYRQYYLSLDFDLSKLPVKSRFLKRIFSIISFIKIPAPGIQVDKNGVRPLLFAF